MLSVEIDVSLLSKAQTQQQTVPTKLTILYFSLCWQFWQSYPLRTWIGQVCEGKKLSRIQLFFSSSQSYFRYLCVQTSKTHRLYDCKTFHTLFEVWLFATNVNILLQTWCDNMSDVFRFNDFFYWHIIAAISVLVDLFADTRNSKA